MKQTQTSAFGVPEYDPGRKGRYRPLISPEHLRRLWLAKRKTGSPITKLVSDALDIYFKKGGEEHGRQNKNQGAHHQRRK